MEAGLEQIGKDSLGQPTGGLGRPVKEADMGARSMHSCLSAALDSGGVGGRVASSALVPPAACSLPPPPCFVRATLPWLRSRRPQVGKLVQHRVALDLRDPLQAYTQALGPSPFVARLLEERKHLQGQPVPAPAGGLGPSQLAPAQDNRPADPRLARQRQQQQQGGAPVPPPPLSGALISCQQQQQQPPAAAAAAAAGFDLPRDPRQRRGPMARQAGPTAMVPPPLGSGGPPLGPASQQAGPTAMAPLGLGLLPATAAPDPLQLPPGSTAAPMQQQRQQPVPMQSAQQPQAPAGSFAQQAPPQQQQQQQPWQPLGLVGMQQMPLLPGLQGMLPASAPRPGSAQGAAGGSARRPMQRQQQQQPQPQTQPNPQQAANSAGGGQGWLDQWQQSFSAAPAQPQQPGPRPMQSAVRPAVPPVQAAAPPLRALQQPQPPAAAAPALDFQQLWAAKMGEPGVPAKRKAGAGAEDRRPQQQRRVQPEQPPPPPQPPRQPPRQLPRVPQPLLQLHQEATEQELRLLWDVVGPAQPGAQWQATVAVGQWQGAVPAERQTTGSALGASEDEAMQAAAAAALDVLRKDGALPALQPQQQQYPQQQPKRQEQQPWQQQPRQQQQPMARKLPTARHARPPPPIHPSGAAPAMPLAAASNGTVTKANNAISTLRLHFPEGTNNIEFVDLPDQDGFARVQLKINGAEFSALGAARADLPRAARRAKQEAALKVLQSVGYSVDLQAGSTNEAMRQAARGEVPGQQQQQAYPWREGRGANGAGAPMVQVGTYLQQLEGELG